MQLYLFQWKFQHKTDVRWSMNLTAASALIRKFKIQVFSFLSSNNGSDLVRTFFNCMSVRYVHWDALWILVLGFILAFIFEDMWFYWNGYPFELFNCQPEWLRQRWKPCFIEFRFYVHVHTSLFIFTNNSD